MTNFWFAFRVNQFEVHRQDDRIVIDCIEVIGGKGTAKFIATPYLAFRGNAKKEFYGFGETEKEALCDCLGKIKGQLYSVVCGTDENTID